MENFLKAIEAEPSSINPCKLEIQFSKVISLQNKLKDLREKFYNLPGTPDLTEVEVDLDDCDTWFENTQVGLKLSLAYFLSESVNESKSLETESVVKD